MLLTDSTREGRSDTDRPFRRRHRHWFGEWRGQPAFTKVADDPESAGGLRREAAVLRALEARVPGFVAPRLLDWREADRTLRVEALPGRDLASATRDAGLLDVAAARALGEALATLHRDGGEIAREVGPARTGPAAVHRPAPSGVRGLSAGAIELIALVQRTPALVAHLDRLCGPQGSETLIHGDVRFENVMVGGRPGAALVDWEAAGGGEGLWDVASTLAWGVAVSLATVPQVPGIAPDRLLGAAQIPIAAVRPGLGALWIAYREALKGVSAPSLRRCLELVAVRLVHLAMDTADDLDDLRAVPVLHLQLATNLLDAPDPGCRRILGLPLDDGKGAE